MTIDEILSYGPYSHPVNTSSSTTVFPSVNHMMEDTGIRLDLTEEGSNAHSAASVVDPTEIGDRHLKQLETV